MILSLLKILKVLIKILNNSKFSLALSTYNPLNKLTYKEKFEFLQNKFESETISEAKGNRIFLEDDEEKNSNNIKSYLKDNPVDHLSIPVTNQSENNFRRQINRILYINMKKVLNLLLLGK